MSCTPLAKSAQPVWAATLSGKRQIWAVTRTKAVEEVVLALSGGNVGLLSLNNFLYKQER